MLVFIPTVPRRFLLTKIQLIVCLYLWWVSETGLLLAAGRCRDAALGTRSCLWWFVLFTGLCCSHTYCNPALGNLQTQSPTVGSDQSRVSFATQLHLLANSDLQMAIAQFKTWDDSNNHWWIWDTEHQLQVWPSRCLSHALRISCSKPLSCYLKNIMRNLSTLTSSHSTEEKWLKWQLFGNTLKVQAGFAIVTASLRDHSLSVKVTTN